MFNIIHDTCEAIWDCLHNDMIETPTNPHEWELIAKTYNDLWQFPHCIGAIDGKHICIQAPRCSGSQYHNYKGAFSIVLMAMCDAKYCFTMVDIGAYGRESDGGVFSQSIFGSRLENDTLGIPTPSALPSSEVVAPYVIVGDAAFPLKSYLMKPYPGRNLSDAREIFNYRLSRARRVIENTFGILATRWRIFRRAIVAKPENVERFTKAACVLHNFLQKADNELQVGERSYCPPGFTDTYDNDGQLIEGQWRTEVSKLESVQNLCGNRSSRSACDVRDAFADYFTSPAGQVPWQSRHISRTGPSLDQL